MISLQIPSKPNRRDKILAEIFMLNIEVFAIELCDNQFYLSKWALRENKGVIYWRWLYYDEEELESREVDISDYDRIYNLRKFPFLQSTFLFSTFLQDFHPTQLSAIEF